jgi:hypothetical protein
LRFASRRQVNASEIMRGLPSQRRSSNQCYLMLFFFDLLDRAIFIAIGHWPWKDFSHQSRQAQVCGLEKGMNCLLQSP